MVFLPYPELAKAGTVTYDFTSDTVGQAPAGITTYNYLSGTQDYKVVNDATLGKSFSVNGTNKQDASFDLVENTCSSLDVSLKMNTTIPSNGIKEQNGFLIFSSTGSRKGYMVQWDDHVSNVLKIFRRNDLTTDYSHTLLASGSAYPTTIGNKWRITASEVAGTVTISVYSWDGASWDLELSITDTAHTSGGFAITRPTTSTGAAMIVDDVVIDDLGSDCISSGNIAVTNLSQYQIFQRDVSGEYDIPVSGTYSGTCTAVEASWNSGAYETIDASLSGGTFSGTLLNQSAGQGDLNVRCSNDVDINSSVQDIGIGDVFIVAGQSNAQGRADSAQTYTHPTLKAVAFNENDDWIEANDPIDTETNLGSPWPLVATLIMESENIPVGFITTAKGGTALVDPPEWDVPSGTWYLNMLDQVSDSGVNAFKAVFWHQGENDVNNSVTKNEYKLALEDLTDAIGTNISGNPPIMVAQIGYKTTSSPSREDLDAIRIAQSELWDENSDILAGPSLYDVGPLADGVHFSTNLQIQTLANRWWASIEEAFYSGAKGRGPKFLKAVEDDTRTILYVYFNNIEETLLPSESIEGFRVEDDGVSVTISSVELINEEIVKITLSSALEGVATVSLGSGNDMGNLTDSSEYSLPAEAFVEESVDVDNLAPADPTINNISIGDTSISGTAESGTIITVDDVTCSNSPIIVGYDGLWECQNVSPAISYGTYTAVSTDIGGNESSDTYEIIAPVIAEATPRRTYGTTRLNRNNITVNDKVCNVIKIYQNLKIGARDGLYNNFTKGVVVDVKNLQTYLKSLGFNPGPIDGIFGQMTFNEVKRWQSQLGLLSDGVIGPISRSFIKNNCDNN